MRPLGRDGGIVGEWAPHGKAIDTGASSHFPQTRVRSALAHNLTTLASTRRQYYTRRTRRDPVHYCLPRERPIAYTRATSINLAGVAERYTRQSQKLLPSRG
jgi:hypothetical protein